MHYILPAADAVQELQEALHAYLKQYDNPMVKKNADALGATNRFETLLKQANTLGQRLNHYKFCLSVLARRIHAKEGVRGQFELVERLWDIVAHHEPIPSSQLQLWSETQLIQYVEQLQNAVDAIAKHVRVSPDTMRRLGMLPSIDDVPTFSYDDCRRIIGGMLLDELITQLNWMPRAEGEYQTHLQRAMLQMFPDWEGLDTDRVRHLPKEHLEVWQQEALRCSVHLYRRVLEPLTLRIARWVNNAIPERTWDIWTIRPLGRDLVLEKGIDFRVWDWERRMENKEWSLGDNLSLFLDPQHGEVSDQCLKDEQVTSERVQKLASLGVDPLLFEIKLGDTPAPTMIIPAAKSVKSQRKSRG